ncbi:hypothetical protein HYALB_00002705 [Hymenoscyphus albidus]|uniref:Carboxymuconolactone decarboxylase-like domain-containing protein n=1 Tax=Hymenoscyphus albidus TaxID=595503 RepID=A0A9N9M0L2_9HELO|nr:hypothetical protein HYALB_00002705 [Hymenoscyphus albidus]
MERTPPIEPENLDEKQRPLYDAISGVMDTHYKGKFAYKTPSGAFLGPMQTLLYTPSLANTSFALQQQLATLPGLPKLARETAILTTSVLYCNEYMQYSHGILAEANGLSNEQIALIKAGRKPDTLDTASSVAYDVATGIIAQKGPLGQELWENGVQVLGREGMLALLHYVGFYSYTSIVLNGCNIEAPTHN